MLTWRTKSNPTAQSREVTYVGLNGKSAAERRSATFEPAQSALPQLLEQGRHQGQGQKSAGRVPEDAAPFPWLQRKLESDPPAVNVTDIRFLSDIVRPLSYNMRIKRSLNDKVIVPSKYGYHPRSHSPTFRRLIAAAELLTQYESSAEDPRVTMSSSEIFDFLNAKFVKRDHLEDCGHRKPPQPNTKSHQRGGEERSGAGNSHHARTRLLTASGSGLLQKQVVQQAELRLGPAQRRTTEDPRTLHRNGHAGSSSPDSEEDEDAIVNHAAGVTSLRIEDNHTELHLFLPQLATSPSSLSKGGSVTSPGSQTHSSPTRGHPYSSSAAMDLTSLPHIDNGKKSGSLTRQRSFGTHKCRSPQKRFRSLTKVLRDTSLKQGYSSEPFERNENLREKLEDVPTLVSLDAES